MDTLITELPDDVRNIVFLYYRSGLRKRMTNRVVRTLFSSKHHRAEFIDYEECQDFFNTTNGLLFVPHSNAFLPHVYYDLYGGSLSTTIHTYCQQIAAMNLYFDEYDKFKEWYPQCFYVMMHLADSFVTTRDEHSEEASDA